MMEGLTATICMPRVGAGWVSQMQLPVSLPLRAYRPPLCSIVRVYNLKPCSAAPPVPLSRPPLGLPPRGPPAAPWWCAQQKTRKCANRGVEGREMRVPVAAASRRRLSPPQRLPTRIVA